MQGSTVLAKVHENQALEEFEIRNNLIIFSLLQLILTTCDPMKPCSQNFHIVPLICSFQEIEIRLFSGTLALGVKAKVSRGQTLKYHLKSDYKTHSLYKDMIQLCP